MKKPATKTLTKNTQEEAPMPPPAPGTPPELPLPTQTKRKGSVSLLAPAATDGSCEALTLQAIQEAIDQIEACLEKAKKDEADNANKTWGNATTYCRQYVEAALNEMNVLQGWLQTGGLATPFVSNATGAFNVNGYAQQGIVDLLSARHWTMISVVYHKSAVARNCYEDIAKALSLLEVLAAQGGRCYMRPYFP